MKNHLKLFLLLALALLCLPISAPAQITIQNKRSATEAGIPTLADGQFCYATDTGRLFIGTNGLGNKLVGVPLRVQLGGVLQPAQNTLNFTGSGVTVADDPTNNRTNVTIAGGGSGTVTSVSLAAPSILSVSGSPVTSTGTLTLSLATQSANLVFAGPGSGSAAAPTFRSLVPLDYPVFGASGGSHARGAVPDPGSSSGTTRYLREDGSWSVPPDTIGVPTSRTLTAGTGLSGGGDLTANRTISLTNTAVTPGSYTNSNITVDAQGRLTAASSGSGGGSTYTEATWTSDVLFVTAATSTGAPSEYIVTDAEPLTLILQAGADCVVDFRGTNFSSFAGKRITIAHKAYDVATLGKKTITIRGVSNLLPGGLVEDVVTLDQFGDSATLAFDSTASGEPHFICVYKASAGAWPQLDISASTTLTKAKLHVRADATSGGALTVTLPDAASFLGQEIGITRINASGSDVIVAPSGSDALNLPTGDETLGGQWDNLSLRAVDLGGGSYGWDRS